jgi:hypothetical protein
MKRVVIGLAVSLLAAGSALASDKSDILAVLKQWNDTDEAKAAATCADDASVIDDIPPFEWHGPSACARWQKDYDAYAKKRRNHRRNRHDRGPSAAHYFWRPRICSGSDHVRAA